jgi:hypothetical protein
MGNGPRERRERAATAAIANMMNGMVRILLPCMYVWRGSPHSKHVKINPTNLAPVLRCHRPLRACHTCLQPRRARRRPLLAVADGWRAGCVGHWPAPLASWAALPPCAHPPPHQDPDPCPHEAWHAARSGRAYGCPTARQARGTSQGAEAAAPTPHRHYLTPTRQRAHECPRWRTPRG